MAKKPTAAFSVDAYYIEMRLMSLCREGKFRQMIKEASEYVPDMTVTQLALLVAEVAHLEGNSTDGVKVIVGRRG